MISDIYKQLKEKDYDLYVRTINLSQGIAFNNKLSLNASAILEETLIRFIYKEVVKNDK